MTLTKEQQKLVEDNLGLAYAQTTHQQVLIDCGNRAVGNTHLIILIIGIGGINRHLELLHAIYSNFSRLGRHLNCFDHNRFKHRNLVGCSGIAAVVGLTGHDRQQNAEHKKQNKMQKLQMLENLKLVVEIEVKKLEHITIHKEE